MEKNNTVDSFLEKLQSMSATTKKRPTVNRRIIDKVFTNFKGNYGRYQVLPMNSVISGFPYVTLMNTREICIPRRNVAADGTESTFNAWIRLLPESAYTMKDPSSGREVSSLTAADEALLKQAYTVYEELYKELDARNNAMDPTIGGLIRRKNYTVFHAYCVNQWTNGDMRNPSRSNFSALFVVTAKGFVDDVNNNIQDTNFTAGRENWVDEIYNRDLTGRKGFFMFSINKTDSPGFSISMSHNLNAAAYLASISIPEEDAELMSNPVETFLGWQAKRDDETPVDQRRLFNPDLIKEAIDFMSDQIVKIRIAKKNGTDVKEAIEETNRAILAGQEATNTRGQATNDPVLASMAAPVETSTEGGYGSSNVAADPETVAAKNTNPFQTPPASHLDPISGTPAFGGAPSFNSGFGGNDLPF